MTLEALEKLSVDASPAPWKLVDPPYPQGLWDITNDAGNPSEEYSKLDYPTEEDTKLIVAMRNALPDLVKELRFLREMQAVRIRRADWMENHLNATLEKLQDAKRLGGDVRNALVEQMIESCTCDAEDDDEHTCWIGCQAACDAWDTFMKENR